MSHLDMDGGGSEVGKDRLASYHAERSIARS